MGNVTMSTVLPSHKRRWRLEPDGCRVGSLDVDLVIHSNSPFQRVGCKKDIHDRRSVLCDAGPAYWSAGLGHSWLIFALDYSHSVEPRIVPTYMERVAMVAYELTTLSVLPPR